MRPSLCRQLPALTPLLVEERQAGLVLGATARAGQSRDPHGCRCGEQPSQPCVPTAALVTEVWSSAGLAGPGPQVGQTGGDVGLSSGLSDGRFGSISESIYPITWKVGPRRQWEKHPVAEL